MKNIFGIFALAVALVLGFNATATAHHYGHVAVHRPVVAVAPVVAVSPVVAVPVAVATPIYATPVTATVAVAPTVAVAAAAPVAAAPVAAAPVAAAPVVAAPVVAAPVYAIPATGFGYGFGHNVAVVRVVNVNRHVSGHRSAVSVGVHGRAVQVGGRR